ncbi:MAG: hypothetical protein CVV06_08125 [Gammaproteobacteria bacterium HGW-Gammaproteobacteria-10]|nr:MAG: hypothetical protein CVV06_08125 [Gammaproteobacteria bacterium HGW-Gammaproteobacteria-10]
MKTWAISRFSREVVIAYTFFQPAPPQASSKFEVRKLYNDDSKSLGSSRKAFCGLFVESRLKY